MANLSRRFLDMKQKYSKWVVGAASAALVASAIVPVASAASFSDIETSDHKDAILALAEAKIVGGYTDGTFKPNAVVTRGNVAKFLGKWLISEGYEIPADYKTEARFTDLPTSAPDQELLQYAALVKDAGVFKGSNNKLMYTNNMNREQMAVVLVRAINTVYNVDLVADYKESDFKSAITDLDKATATENREAIIALEYAGLTNVKAFNPKNSLTRGQFASFLHRTITNVGEAALTVKEAKVVDATTLEVTLSDDTKHTVKLETPLEENKETKVEFEIEGKTYSAVVTYEVTEVKLESVKAVSSKSIEVAFNKAVDFTAADFTVNKGTVKANVASVALSEDKKTATIELTSKLTEGEYTVTVAQKEADALKGSVKVENEKVAKLDVLSDVAAFTSTAKTAATVGVKVSNQYGEDITKLNHSDVTVTVAGAATAGSLNADGTLNLTLAAGAKEGDNVIITLVHAKTGVTAQATVKLSAVAAISDITFGELYNKDGKTLSQDTDLSKDKFYLPVTTKDQYGKEVTNLTTINNEVLLTNSNPGVVSLSAVKTVTINGKEVNVVEVTGTNLAGTSNLIAVSKTTGKSATTTVAVSEGVKLSSVSVSAPTEVLSANKDAFFPLTVVDTQGKEIKTLKELSAVKQDTLTESAGYDIVEVTGKTGLFVKVPANKVEANKAVTVVVTTLSGKVSTQTIVAKAEAKATVITGLNSKVATALRAKDVTGVTVKNTDLVVEDQYGQVITDTTVLGAIQFEASVEAGSASDKAFTVTNTANTSANIVAKAGTTETSGKVSFKLLDGATPVESSALTKTFSIVSDSQFASYTVEDVPTIYANAADGNKVVTAYDKAIVVKAKTASGEVVELKEGTDFTVTGKPAAGSAITFADKETTAKKTVTITINATGEELTKELTYSNVAPKVAKVQVVKDGTAAAAVADATKLEEAKAVEFTATSAFNLTELAKLVDFVVTDTYGVAVAADETAGVKVTLADTTVVNADTLTLTKVSGEVEFANNGTLTAAVSKFTAGSEFNALVKFGGVAGNLVKVTATTTLN